jgi:RecA-family ATPase
MVSELPEDVSWLVKPWLRVGSITLLTGKPKAGKTTFLLHMINAVLGGTSFLGEPTCCTPVVYLAEKPRAAFLAMLKRMGLSRADLHVVFPQDLEVPWEATVARAVQKCREVGATLLVVDTLAGVAQLRNEQARSMLDALRPLQEAADAGIAICVNHHDRKGGGEVGDSARGSNALVGAVDVVLSIRRIAEDERVRVIHGQGRFDETPSMLAVELTADGYVLAQADFEANEEDRE